MKQYLIYILFLAATSAVFGQSSSQNFVLSRTFKQTGAPVNDLNKVQIQIQYLDGLGRPSQTISVGQSTAGLDNIVSIEYDSYGRQPKGYLPYAGGGNGAFQTNAITNQAAFYSANTAQLEASDLGRPFIETQFEVAPAARPLSTQAPGNKSASASITYTVNGSNEVKKYTYSANADITQTIPTGSVGYYDAGKLFKVITVDENSKESTQYTDIKGRLICKIAGVEGLTTYYVYDDFGLLRAVLQPRFQDTGSAADFAFLYDYDGRGRVITKRVPGSGNVDIVYDNFDRQAMSQDANQKIRGVWRFTKYDALGRKVMSGEVSNPAARSSLQSSFDASTAHHEARNGSTVGYSWGGTLPAVSETDILNVTYYDNYSFPGNQAYVNVFAVSPNTSVKAQQTGRRTRMLNAGAQWLVSTIHYDAEYRPIQTVRELHDLGSSTIERVSTKYKYDLAAVIDQQNTSHESSGSVTNSLLKTFTYDHADRLLSIKESVSMDGSTKEATTVAHRYNVLGQLKEKWLHSDDASKFRQRTDYTNNIRGWVTDGKTVYRQSSAGDLPFFTYKLDYANGINYSNGNISKMEWSGKDDTGFNAGLKFTYDGVNRLTSADKPYPAGLPYDYKETETGIGYDKNGNITALTRGGATGAIDILGYTYSGNRLSDLSDGGTAAGVNMGAGSFSYDANGNMTSDKSRNPAVTSIYNYINLPKSVTAGGNTLTYDYDASGAKHKYSSSAAANLTIKYAGVFEYDNANVVKRLALQEGQAVIRAGALHFDYYVKDHLGNVRVVFDELGNILPKTDYTPFGYEIDRSTPSQTPAVRFSINKYNFLSRETQLATGYIDLNRRFFDPLTGRFTSIDPVTEGQEDQSTYQYGWNNPILRSDPNGDFPDCCKGVGDFLTGVGQALSDDIVGGTPIRATPGYVDAYNSGRTVGHYAAMAIGATEIAAGAIGDVAAVVGEIGSVGLATPVAVPVAAVSTAVIVHGTAAGARAAENLRNDKGRVEASSKKVEGSYTTSHQSGKRYHGKGDEPRAKKSATDKAKANNDPVTDIDWKPSKNSREAFKDESRRLDTDKVGPTPGHKNPNNYNKRDSPGKKYRNQDGD